MYRDSSKDNIENGMLLGREKDESDYTYEDYLADEADRLYDEQQFEDMNLDETEEV